MRVFLASPAHTPDERARLGQLAEVVKAAGHEPLLPEGDGRIERLQGADAIVGIVDGAQPASEVAFALGFARARGLPALGLRSDARAPAGGADAGVLADGLFAYAQGDWKDLESALFGFLTKPPARAAEVLVRDRVPTRLRQEGVEFDVRRVEGPQALAQALKRHLVLEAQRLLAAPEGDERETMAEVLELVETLLEVRHYDPANLRRVKERLEADEGGYAQGYLVRGKRGPS
jgi:predicted house-cleaning noncanonical NTP pyrophosphatase (MazG superfamily)